jgi:hypothetical protein
MIHVEAEISGISAPAEGLVPRGPFSLFEVTPEAGEGGGGGGGGGEGGGV